MSALITAVIEADALIQAFRVGDVSTSGLLEHGQIVKSRLIGAYSELPVSSIAYKRAVTKTALLTRTMEAVKANG